MSAAKSGVLRTTLSLLHTHTNTHKLFFYEIEYWRPRSTFATIASILPHWLYNLSVKLSINWPAPRPQSYMKIDIQTRQGPKAKGCQTNRHTMERLLLSETNFLMTAIGKSSSCCLMFNIQGRIQVNSVRSKKRHTWRMIKDDVKRRINTSLNLPFFEVEDQAWI